MSERTPSRAGEALERWLADNDRSQMWLAGQLGVSQSAVSAWIAGMQPKVNVAVAIERLTKRKVMVEMWGQSARTARTGTEG